MSATGSPRWPSNGAAHGFTVKTVLASKDLDPAAAARLHAHGISPAALQQHIVATPTGSTSLWQAVTSGALSAAEAVNQHQAAGPPEPAARPSTSAPAASTPRPAPAVFSHPVAALDPDNAHRRCTTPHMSAARWERHSGRVTGCRLVTRR
jgi:hypothetical protein